MFSVLAHDSTAEERWPGTLSTQLLWKPSHWMESIGRGRSPNALKLFQINLQLKKKVGVTFNEDPWSGEILLQVMIDLVRTGL